METKTYKPGVIRADDLSWDFVCAYFGLDGSFQYSELQREEYYRLIEQDQESMHLFERGSADVAKSSKQRPFFGIWSDVSWPWYGGQPLCRMVIDVANDMLIAAQVLHGRKWEDLSVQECIDVAQSLFDEHNVSADPVGNGFSAVKAIPQWAEARKVMVSRQSRSVAAATAAIKEHANALGIEGDSAIQIWHLVASLQEYCAANAVDLDAQLADVRKKIAAGEIESPLWVESQRKQARERPLSPCM